MRRTPQAPRSGGRSPFLRRLVPVAVVGAALALSACQSQSPIQTEVPYSPADGVAVDLGQVQVRDLVIIASGKDQPGVLSGSLINTGNNEQRVAFAMQTGQQVTTTAPAHSEQPLSDSTQVQLSSVPVAPGDVIKLSVQSAGAATVVVTVPVLPPSGYYATLNPTSQPSTTTTATP